MIQRFSDIVNNKYMIKCTKFMIVIVRFIFNKLRYLCKKYVCSVVVLACTTVNCNNVTSYLYKKITQMWKLRLCITHIAVCSGVVGSTFIKRTSEEEKANVYQN